MTTTPVKVTVVETTPVEVITEKKVLEEKQLLVANKDKAYLTVFWTILGAMIVWIIALLIASKNIKAGFYDNVAINRSNWIPNASALLLIWLFAILFYGYASGRGYGADCSGRRAVTLTLFILQLLLTLLWFYFFFNTLNYQAAGIVAIIMLILAIVQVIYTWKYDRTAAWITILYAVWLLIITIISWQLYNNRRAPNVTATTVANAARAVTAARPPSPLAAIGQGIRTGVSAVGQAAGQVLQTAGTAVQNVTGAVATPLRAL